MDYLCCCEGLVEAISCVGLCLHSLQFCLARAAQSLMAQMLQRGQGSESLAENKLPKLSASKRALMLPVSKKRPRKESDSSDSTDSERAYVRKGSRKSFRQEEEEEDEKEGGEEWEGGRRSEHIM